MKTQILPFAVALCFAAPLATSAAKEIRLADCPPAVQAAINANARSGAIDDVKNVMVDGRSMYVADVNLPGKRDLKIYVSGTGALLKVREEVPLDEVPAAIREAAQKLTPEGGRIDDVDKETAEGKVTYEVDIDRPKAEDLKVVFAADGTILSQR
jgi:hypothetical protein